MQRRVIPCPGKTVTQETQAPAAKPTVAFAHLGCEKNRVDTEHMLGLLAEAGYGVSADESDATLVVVNTCRDRKSVV